MKYPIFVVKQVLFYFDWNIQFFSCNRFFLLSLEYGIFQFLPSTRFISILWNMEYSIFYPQQVFSPYIRLYHASLFSYIPETIATSLWEYAIGIFLEYSIFQKYNFLCCDAFFLNIPYSNKLRKMLI